MTQAYSTLGVSHLKPKGSPEEIARKREELRRYFPEIYAHYERSIRDPEATDSKEEPTCET